MATGVKAVRTWELLEAHAGEEEDSQSAAERATAMCRDRSRGRTMIKRTVLSEDTRKTPFVYFVGQQLKRKGTKEQIYRYVQATVTEFLPRFAPARTPSSRVKMSDAVAGSRPPIDRSCS